MPNSNLKSKETLVLVSQQNGVTVIPQPTPLTRLNYFDGKFLRASDLSAEQLYLRRLVDLSNQAGGSGVAHGYNLSLAAGGDTLNVGPGLAIDPQGRVLLLPEDFSIGVQELIERSRQLKTSPTTASGGSDSFGDCIVVKETPPANVLPVGDLYLITIGFAEALCGQEDVFGRLCEEACTTSTDRPYLVEGVILRATALQLQTPLPTSAAVALSQLHLRSRVASFYFEDERKRVASFISGEGLRSNVWCLGAEAAGGVGVPLGVIARAGNTTLFLDAWIARRERMDTPAKRYWQWRMAMRPWDVFLAQILQFQCQLSGLFKKTPQAAGDDDPCASTKAVIQEASEAVAIITTFYQTVSKSFTIQPLLTANTASAAKAPTLDLAALGQLQKRLQDSAATFIPGDQILIDGGIIELPSAGYLPVLPNRVISVNEQVRRLMGMGVDLRFCIVRPDFVAHALEEAQHMERISLLQGLEDTERKPKVDILVPNGEIIEQKLLSPGLGFEATLNVNNALFGFGYRAWSQRTLLKGAEIHRGGALQFRGAARTEKLLSGGGAAYLSAEWDERSTLEGASEWLITERQQDERVRAGAWVSLRCERNIFELQPSESSNINALGIIAAATANAAPTIFQVTLDGTFSVTDGTTTSGAARSVKGSIKNGVFSFLVQSAGSSFLIDLDAAITLTDDSKVEIVISYKGNDLKLSASWDKQPMEIRAEISAQEFIIANAELQENADVSEASHVAHIRALDALDIVARALADPTFAAAKARSLFPLPQAPIDEITVRGTADWVLFHGRRDKQCASILAPQKPPLSYRVLNKTVKTLDEATNFADSLNADSPALGAYIRTEWSKQPELFIRYAGNSEQPLFDFADVNEKWKHFNPGALIAFAWYGSRDNDNQALQTNRLRQFESAVSGTSSEYESTQIRYIEPFPPGTLPLDADGVMIFITHEAQPVTELLYAFSRETPVGPSANISFAKSEPQESALKGYLDKLKKFKVDKSPAKVRYVWIASTKTKADSEAAKRGKTFREKIEQAGLTIDGALGEAVQVAVLSEKHKDGIKQRLGPDSLNGIDDVILLEFVKEHAAQEAIGVEVTVASAKYKAPNRTMEMKLRVTNRGVNPVKVGEYYTASARFLDAAVVKDIKYPEDLLAESGLTIDDPSPISEGQSRITVVTVSGTTWDVPDKQFKGLLFFLDAASGVHSVEIEPNPTQVNE